MAVPARRVPVPRQLPAPRSRPPLRVVPPRRGSARRRPSSSRRRVPFFLVAVVLVAALVVGLTSAQALVAEGAFRLSELSKRAEQLDVSNDLLRLQVARLSSPDRIARQAARAGLIRPRRVEILPSEAGG